MAIPTPMSKVIPVNLDFKSSSISNWKPFNTGMGFWTNDIGTAFLEFSTELDLTGTVAFIVLENQYDKSLVQKTITEITSSPFYYQLGDEIQHEGRWFVQISVKKGEETIVSNSFAFMVNASIGHRKVARLVSIETFETLATQLTALQTDISNYLETAETNEAIRVSTYDEIVLVEETRKEAEDIREANDISRGATATADNTRANTDHTRANTDHTRANTDHTTALADHTSYEGLLTDGVLATNIENKLLYLEETYAPNMVSLTSQLADTLNKSAITLTHMFADNTARDAYFVAHPTELVDLQFIKVGTGYQQYIEGVWQASTAIVAEQLSATNQPIVDTGNYFTTDNTNAALQEMGAHKASTANPHGVTKTQVGLGNVDNTSDANKPVSTAGQTALNLKADKTTTDGHATRIIALESNAVKQYGIRRTLNASSTLLERLNDGIGLVANVPTDDGAAQNDFDAVYPFNQIKECIIDATGRIHYKGDPTYAAAIGDWMVEVPLYYVKDVRTATTQDEYFSAFKLDGYRIPKDFIREDGTVCKKIYYGRFKTGKNGTADVSRPGLVPSNYRDLASFRTGARAKGAGWQEVGINYVKDFLHKLYKIEFANLNSQTVFGPGITSVRYTATDKAVLAETAVNRFVITTVTASNFSVGNVINIGTSLGGNNVASMRVITAINVLDASNSEIVFDGAAVNIAIGNVIAMVAQKTGQTANLQKPSGKLSGISGRTSFKWRGIEDPFGNLYEWVDGVLINDNKGYICNKPSLFASTLTADYKPLSHTNANTNSYPFEMGYDENYPEAQFPIAVGAGSSTGYADYYYQNTGLRGVCFGGYATYGTAAGLFCWPLADAPSYAPWNLGGRLMYKPPAN